MLPERAALALSSAVDVYASELAEYAELILGRGADPIGFMARGEGPSFTRRTEMLLRGLDMPPEAIEHARWLAEWFEHRRAFVKLEWHRGPGETVIPHAACYFRRRPEVDTVVARLASRGVRPAVTAEVTRLAAALEKATFHFVAAAFRPGTPVHHKVYCSQYLTLDTAAAVEARLATVLASSGVAPAAIERWRAWHRAWATGRDETTLFASIAFTAERRLPWIKLDYPDVSPDAAAAWATPAAQAEVRREADVACRLAGIGALSYLGVRLGGDHVDWKLYADMPAAGGAR